MTSLEDDLRSDDNDQLSTTIVRQKLDLSLHRRSTPSCIGSLQPIHGGNVDLSLSRRRNDDCLQGLVITPSNTSAVMGCFCHQHRHHHHQQFDQTPQLTSHTIYTRQHLVTARRKFKSFPFLLVLQLILVLFSNYGQAQLRQGEESENCHVSKCPKTFYKAYPKNMPAPELPANPTYEQIVHHFEQLKAPCQAVQTMRRCLTRMRTPCVGDLYYHSYKRTQDTQSKKFQCRERRRFAKAQQKAAAAQNDTIASNISGETTSSPPTSPTTTTTMITPTTTSTTTTVISSVATPTDKCVYKAAPNDKYSHCAMFGDPHLRTFSDRFYTCSIAGTWQLIDNRHLVVMATNVEVLPGSEATITSKITVLIKSDDNCADDRTYVATTEQGLPGAFKDGSTVSKIGGIRIDEIVPAAHIEITIPYINTLIVIRNVGNYLTFAARMPSQLVKSLQSTDDQICVIGCRANSKVPATSGNQFQPGHRYQAPPTPKPLIVFDEKEARLQCRGALLKRLGYANSVEEITNEVGVIEEPVTVVEDADVEEEDTSQEMAASTADEADGFPFHNKRFSFDLLHTNEDGSSKEQRNRKNPRSRKRHAKHRRGKQRSRRPVKRDLENLSSPPSPPCIVGKSDSSHNFYFESCVFDLMTTGDANLTLAAAAALEDVRVLHDLGEKAPGASVEVIQRWPEVRICPPTHPIERDGEEPVLAEQAITPGSGASKSSQQASVCLVLLCTLASCILLGSAQTDSFQSSSIASPTDLNITYDVASQNGVIRTLTSHQPSPIPVECS